MDFTSEDYLTNTEERIDHLRRVVNGRPVAILTAGPSIKELEKRISELQDVDICYFGFNNFRIQEEHILQQINRHFSVMMSTVPAAIPLFLKDIIIFLNRDEDNMFVSSFGGDIYTFGQVRCDFDLNQFISKYNQKLIFFDLKNERTFPNSSYPFHFIGSNSLLMLIQLAIIGKASKVVIFGADGYSDKKNGEHYYRQNEYKGASNKILKYVTDKQYNPVAPIAIRNTYETYDLKPIEIINCSEKSFYTPFPNVSYNYAFEYLLKDEIFNRKFDLRIPKVSIITQSSSSVDFLRESIENILHQSYSNHEHIIIFGKNEVKIQNLRQQFPHVIWISEKEFGTLGAFEEAVTVAKGEYVIYNSNNSYFDQDWVNTCVEVLENNPNISLVWGLSQCISEDTPFEQRNNTHSIDKTPSQDIKFVYYWLKNKTVFPEGTTCVRKNVLKECYPFDELEYFNQYKAWLAFNYKFNTSGYLPHFISNVYNYCNNSRVFKDMHEITSEQKWLGAYHADVEQFEINLINKKTIHHYRSGDGKLFPGGFSQNTFLFCRIGRYLESKTPPRICLSVFEMALNYWMLYHLFVFRLGIIFVYDKVLYYWNTYRWGAIKVGIVNANLQLKKLRKVIHS